MASKAKEKFQLLQKDEIECSELINKFKKNLDLWFIYGMIDKNILKELLNSCVDIILYGLRSESEKVKGNKNAMTYDSTINISLEPFLNVNNKKNGNSEIRLSELLKIINDFDWIRNEVCIKQNSTNTLLRSDLSMREIPSILSSFQEHYLTTQTQTKNLKSSIASHVEKWLKHNLNEHNLCGFLQYLVNDKELLEEHYYDEALLRQKNYVKILVMGLTAFETQQYGLLSQIETLLKEDIGKLNQPKKSNSQPNIFLVPVNKSNFTYLNQPAAMTSVSQNYATLSLTAIRKTQSLPECIDKKCNINDDFTERICWKRGRCKTIAAIKHKIKNPQRLPQKVSDVASNYNIKVCKSPVVTPSSSAFIHDYDDNQPTTSHSSSNRSKSPLSSYTLNSNKSVTSSLMSTSESSSNSISTAKRIQLINTDDIKIWTDHSWELKQKSRQLKHLEPTISCTIPTPSATTTKPCKSLSPLNSFFSSLFSTPPSYTSWFIDHDSETVHETTETAIDSITSDNNNIQNSTSISLPQQQSTSLSIGSTVFDKFLPIDGKKVRSRKSQNLFDDVNTTLECSGINNKLESASCLSIESPTSDLSPASISVASKNCQSLTRFLQMSHLSRHNTDLEKENAHFRISEAIISAIEHIKWNKLETQRDNSCEATALATDCLTSAHPLQSSNVTVTFNNTESEHIPYAELEEVSYDLLSAEVVGLSLISKFDEKHLPKVSELKWLVSDDDTPQKLLPMPDLSSSANPDDHVIHSATRGTRYWAPPRQQIIFTDHPSSNRKELLKKQNYRCAGCGMRVSPQHIQSFRYCTYLGKYHCTGCHRNQISGTPAKILQAWDFKCYPVSVFAYRLLEQMYAYPLFYVPDLNPALYIRCKSLHTARNKRLQLKYVKDFIRMCRFALREQSYFESVPDYITADIDNWSMSDFIDTRTKCLHRSIDELINKCENHIFNCVLCTARGFLCEYCHVDAIIYPWGSRVVRCDCCGTCFHRSCWKSLREKCCRCQRIEKRHEEINDAI